MANHKLMWRFAHSQPHNHHHQPSNYAKSRVNVECSDEISRNWKSNNRAEPGLAIVQFCYSTELIWPFGVCVAEGSQKAIRLQCTELCCALISSSTCSYESLYEKNEKSECRCRSWTNEITITPICCFSLRAVKWKESKHDRVECVDLALVT